MSCFMITAHQRLIVVKRLDNSGLVQHHLSADSLRVANTQSDGRRAAVAQEVERVGW